ncbi:MAG: M48 family metallopeptidase [candidate division WOR-3 bacterium]|nr:M48 family metallopeptidase [candidate division WOR-3 bacterium]
MSLICSRCGYYNSRIRKTCALCNEPLGDNAVSPERKHSFYDIQASNRRKSVILIVLLSSILLLIGYGAGLYFGNIYYGLAIALGIALILNFTAYSGGKAIVLKTAGAVKADDNKHRQLINIVEEMSIAAGIRMPEVYIIKTKAMNAFATGKSPDDSAIAVTTGLIDRLSRDELTGVIAHEMSHVKNMDIRFAMYAGVLVGSIIILSDLILRFIWLGSGRRRRNEGGGGILIIVIIVIAVIAPLLSKLIQMSVSRKRELLADSSAAELTRNPGALADALEKIALSFDSKETRMEKPSRALQHMYILNPLQKAGEKSKGLFSTHPPAVSRIRILRSM